VHIDVGGEEIICTNEHPFYVPQKGWIAACKLRAGDILVLLNGKYAVVEQIQHELLEEATHVYNFEVEDFHTYYVGCIGVLVHNSCAHQTSEWKSKRTTYWRNRAKEIINNNQIEQRFDSFTSTNENIARMLQGKAPIGWDGYSVELHHVNGIKNNFNNIVETSRTLHQAIHAFFK